PFNRWKVKSDSPRSSPPSTRLPLTPPVQENTAAEEAYKKVASSPMQNRPSSAIPETVLGPLPAASQADYRRSPTVYAFTEEPEMSNTSVRYSPVSPYSLATNSLDPQPVAEDLVTRLAATRSRYWRTLLTSTFR